MTQEEFDKKMEKACMASNSKAAVAIAMRLAYYNPELAAVWYLKQLKAVQD